MLCTVWFSKLHLVLILMMRNPATVEAVGQAIWEPDTRNLLERGGVQDQRIAISTSATYNRYHHPYLLDIFIYLLLRRNKLIPN
jgi:hypothetical protein